MSRERNTARQLMFGPKQLEGWSNLSHDFKPLRRRQHMVNNQNNSFCGNRYGLPSLHHTPADTGLIHPSAFNRCGRITADAYRTRRSYDRHII